MKSGEAVALKLRQRKIKKLATAGLVVSFLFIQGAFTCCLSVANSETPSASSGACHEAGAATTQMHAAKKSSEADCCSSMSPQKFYNPQSSVQKFSFDKTSDFATAVFPVKYFFLHDGGKPIPPPLSQVTPLYHKTSSLLI